MKLSASALGKTAALLAGAAVATLLLLWQGLPRLIHWQAGRFVAENTGHRLVMERPAFDPFELALRFGKLQLSDPEGQPLFGFDGLLVDISGASIAERALVFDAIRLDGPAATLVELPDGKLNWTPFLAALKIEDEPPAEKTGLPRFDIRSFVLAGGKVDYADRRRTAEGFATTIAPLDLEFADLSTLPDDAGRFNISARTALGAQVHLAGQIDLDPLMVAGTFNLADLQLAKLAPYLKKVLPVPPEGVLGLSASYRAGNGGEQFDATVEQIQARLTGLRVALKDEEANGPMASVAAIELKDGRFQLASHKLVVGTLRLVDGQVRAVRRKDGSIDLLEAFGALGGKPQPPAGIPWRYRVETVEIADSGVVLQDASVTPGFELTLERIAARVVGVGDDPAAPLPVRLSFDIASGGRFVGAGRVVPASGFADIDFNLDDLSLKPFQPFLAARTTLTLADGNLAAQGRAIYDAKGPRLKGEFALRDLRLTEPGASAPLLAWQTLGSRDWVLTREGIDLGELRLVGLDTRIGIDRDRNAGFKRTIPARAGRR